MREMARQPARTRRDLFQETSSGMRTHPAIAEKDFWVCWILDYLFQESVWKDVLAFKGGTSLSKAFGLIERFSEDIDLVLAWPVLGYSPGDLKQDRTATQLDRFAKEANRKTADFLRNTFAPALRLELPPRATGDLEIDVEGENVLIRYPGAFSLNAIRPEVRLEIGPLALWTPNTVRDIQPYAAGHFPGAFGRAVTQVRTIDAERTFWEKATILHQEAHRAPEKTLPDRHSRHYYDLYRMGLHPVRDRAINQLELLDEVVSFKRQYFRSAWANYDAAKPGSLRLLPAPPHRKRLLNDYAKMQAMLFGEVPEFKAIEQGLAKLESLINERQAGGKVKSLPQVPGKRS